METLMWVLVGMVVIVVLGLASLWLRGRRRSRLEGLPWFSPERQAWQGKRGQTEVWPERKYEMKPRVKENGDAPAKGRYRIPGMRG